MCVSAWSNLPGRGAAAREARGWCGTGQGSTLSPPTTATPQPRYPRQSPAVGAGSCHRQGEQGKVCTLPACPAGGGSAERSCCPIYSHPPRCLLMGLLKSDLPASTFHTMPRKGACPPCCPAPLPCRGTAGPSCSLAFAMPRGSSFPTSLDPSSSCYLQGPPASPQRSSCHEP